MRSAELARLAGVTVRALRHYHQVGVLVEPARQANGYRNYDVDDLIRVLRIKRLASLGIPLERMPDLLDDANDDAGGLLDELDAELAEQIDRLTRQRELIAHLRAHDARPDVPPELAPFLAVFAASGQTPELARLDRDQTVLVAHLAGEEATARLAHFYERLTDPELMPAVEDISERFSRLGPDSSEQDVCDLIEVFVTAFASVMDEFAAAGAPIDLGPSADILATHASGLLNERQLEALERLEARLTTLLAT